MMERFNFGYSTKNIPLANQHNYKLQLIEKVEAVINRKRWKALFINNGKDNAEKIDTYGLKTANCPKQVRELIPFENDFRKYYNDFQERMKHDIGEMKTSTNTFTAADKTSNFYKIPKEQYNHPKNNVITSN